MDNGQLLSHVDTDLVTRDQLALIPAPEPTKSWRPIPHIELVQTLQQALWENRIGIREEKFALRHDGSTLFGVLQLAYQDTRDGQAALGIRTSNDKTMSIQICAGLSVFVCDNLVFRGDLIALNRKHTAGLDLRTELKTAPSCVCPCGRPFCGRQSSRTFLEDVIRTILSANVTFSKKLCGQSYVNCNRRMGLLFTVRAALAEPAQSLPVAFAISDSNRTKS
jgi:hypothetical protein